MALYCWSSDSQHNPRPRIGVGHSILTNRNDCSPAADLVVAEAVARPWPKETSFSIINVVDLHRFAGLSAFLEESKLKLDHVGAAIKLSAAKLEGAGYRSECKVIEGFPRKAISQHAEEWHADLVNGRVPWS